MRLLRQHRTVSIISGRDGDLSERARVDEFGAAVVVTDDIGRSRRGVVLAGL